MPGIEPGTFSVLTKCDNRYTTRPCWTAGSSALWDLPELTEAPAAALGICRSPQIVSNICSLLHGPLP
jgi:hypothetical protein